MSGTWDTKHRNQKQGMLMNRKADAKGSQPDGDWLEEGSKNICWSFCWCF